MDVKCRCGEPWDVYGLKWEIIQETDLPEKIKKDFVEYENGRNPHQFELTQLIREAFKREGWEFGGSLLVVRRCPCCKGNGKINEKVEVLSEILGHDLDALESEIGE